MCSFVTQHNITDVSSFEGECNWIARGFNVLKQSWKCASSSMACILTRHVDSELNVHFSTISCLQSRFREFGSMSNQPHNCRPCVWRRVGEWFADVNVVDRVPHRGMKLWYELQTWNTIALYWWQFEYTEIPWRDPEAHCETHFFKLSGTNRCISVYPVKWNP